MVEPASQAAHTPSSDNILLVTLDTTRADRLGCYGYEKASTAALDSLAAGGARFEHAVSSIPLTLPSHATLFSGLYPPEHGLHFNSSGSLSEEIQTLPKVLRERGYRTAAFVSAFVLDSRYGLAQGFEVYSDDLPGLGTAAHEVAQIPGNIVTDRALGWLNQNVESNFFCWVHLFDPHDPYEPPEPFKSRFEDPYDGEVSFADAQVARLLQWLKNNSLTENTLVVVVGDHGESLGDHGEDLHGFFVYDSTIRVPLIFSWPGRIGAVEVTSEAVGVVDVFPTILELLDVEKSEHSDHVSGRSLVPLMTGSTLESNVSRPVYAETRVPMVEYHWSPLTALISKPWKYIDSSKPELYDLDADSGESRDVISDNPEVAQKLRHQLDELTESFETHEPGPAMLDEAALRRLRSLGYLQAGLGSKSKAHAEDDELKSPREMIEVYQRARKGEEAIWQQDYETAVRLLQPVIAESPESVRVRFDLAAAYFELRKYRESASEFQAVLRLNPNNAEANSLLGMALDRLGQTEAAVGYLRAAIRLRPGHKSALYNLADMLARTGRVDEAIDFRTRGERAEPESQGEDYLGEIERLRVRSLSNIGSAMARTGRMDDAIATLRQVLRIDPDYADAEHNLGVAFLGKRNLAEGIRHLRRAVSLDPEHTDATFNLAQALAIGGKLPEATTLFQKVVELQPNHSRAHNALGVAFSQQGENRRAVYHFERALSIDPRFAEARRNLKMMQP